MANQMIALGVKAPQTDILGSSIARNAQMINMMRQQDAAERQTAVAQQQMQIARAQEERAAAKDQREASAADIELAGKKIDYYTKLAGQTMNPQGYTLLLNQLDKDAPDIAAAFRANLPPEQFDRNVLLQMVGSIGDNFSATYGPRETEVVVDEKGDYFVAVTGGFGPQGIIPLNTLNPSGPPKRPVSKPAPAPRGGPAAPALSPDAALPAGGVDARPTRGSATTPEDLRMQGVDPRSIPMGNPFKPASFDGGAAQPDLGAVVQQMMETGVVSQSDFNAMRAAAPGKDAQLAEILRANNIQIMPDEQQPGGLQSAVYRPGEGDASMTQAQSLEGYQDTGRQFRGKSPMVSPTAPSKTPKQIYDEEKAKEQAKLDAARNAGPKPLSQVQESRLRANIAKDYKSTQSTIDMMLDPVSGVVAAVNGVRNLSPDQKEAITGYSAYLPSVRSSTKTADTKVANLVGKVTEMGKAAASLGGAIGNMAVQEWKIVRDMIASLDLEGMNASDLDDQLDIIESAARRAAQTTRDAYENQYAEDFARYPGRFQIKEAGGATPPPRNQGRRTPTGVDRNNPLLKGM